MARVPEGELERLKAEISIERLAESQGILLERRGGDRVGLCPFHDDKEPSLVITPSKNLWHCLGACQAGGSVVDWVMRAEGVSFRHAVELLQADYQPTSAPKSEGKRSTVQKLPTALEASAEDGKLALQVVEYYHEQLLQSPEAMAYLEKRGVASGEAVSKFKLGFANRTLGYRLPAKNRKEGAAIRGALQRVGLLRPSGHEHLNGSIVFPIFGERGEVTEVYGRKITPGLRKGTPLHLYLPGPHRGVWNREALEASQEIILCESLIDALTFWCAGFRNVTASYGVEGFTKDHLEAFKQSGTERVLIAYDRDAAGDAAAEKLAKQLQGEGLDCYRIQFPKGLDANDFALRVTPASKSLGMVIRAAQWLGKGEAKPLTTQTVGVEPAPIEREAPSSASSPPSKPDAVADNPRPAEPERKSVPVDEPNPPLAAVAEAVPAAKEGKMAEALPAAVLPPAPRAEVEAEATGDEVDGEIVVYGHNVMKGYHNLPEENAKVFTEDGGFRTGDMGHMDEDGYVYITGRVKEQYKLENGKYVVPTPLEEKLKLSPFIANVMVYGHNKPYNVALIIPDMETLAKWAEEHGLDPSEPKKLLEDPKVRELYRDEIEKWSKDFKQYEKIRDFTFGTEDFTIDNGMLTPSLKLKRRGVMQRYGEQLQALYEKRKAA